MGNTPNSKPKTTTIIIKKSVELPKTLTSGNEFFEKWPSWKNDFLKYQKTMNIDIHDKQKWGNKMINTMGPIGQDIFNNFTFDPLEKKDNIDILINKFDEYYIFGASRRKIRENVFEYINELQTITEYKRLKNSDDWIRKKILTEIDKNQFLTAAKTMIPTFTFFNHFNQLTLKEIGFIWMLYCDDLMRNCKRCGSDHNDNDKCPANGVQCTRCNALNHYNRRCPQVFILNCHFCGGCHFNKKCPAYNETCTKCRKQNHFSWKCEQYKVLRCKFCGLTHAMSKSVCSARNTVCSKCHTMGHFSSMCNRTSR